MDIEKTYEANLLCLTLIFNGALKKIELLKNEKHEYINQINDYINLVSNLQEELKNTQSKLEEIKEIQSKLEEVKLEEIKEIQSNLEEGFDIQDQIISSIRAGKNIFITGCGGVGKSYMIGKIKDEFPDTILTATTGVAAVCIKGRTLHSFAGIGIARDSKENLHINMRKMGWFKSRWSSVKLIVVDEISMLDAEYLEKLDYVLRNVLRNNNHFGGVQFVFVGDFFQLPPVKGDFCFTLNLWKTLETFELTKVYRQTDQVFVNLLKRMRIGEMIEDDHLLLMNESKKNKKWDDNIIPTKLRSHKYDVHDINEKYLNELKSTPKTYSMTYEYEELYEVKVSKTNKEKFINNIVDNLQAHDELILKKGAQVMLLINMDFEEELVNGSRGVIVGFSGDLPLVRFTNGIEKVIVPYTWEFPDVGGKALISQIPLILAWACTIHKSQGSTLDRVELSLDHKIFACGQAYVALSRVRNLEGLVLKTYKKQCVKVNKDVKEYYQNLKLK